MASGVYLGGILNLSGCPEDLLVFPWQSTLDSWYLHLLRPGHWKRILPRSSTLQLKVGRHGSVFLGDDIFI
jgi:hypothetical protein